MLCNNCGKREATLRYEENINGEKKKINLCKECSDNLGIFNMNFMDNMLLSFFDEPIGIGVKQLKEKICPKCGYSFSDYANTGLLGCPECYETFEEKLEPALKKLHGKSYHVKSEIKRAKPKNKLEELKQELEEAVQKEEYEKAAVIRDKIKDLKKRGDK